MVHMQCPDYSSRETLLKRLRELTNAPHIYNTRSGLVVGHRKFVMC